MIQKVILPKLGETVEVSTIERWIKNEGDTVAAGDILCEITTDKATLEVESYYRGTLLRILAPPGTELPVGSVIAVIGEKGEAIPQDILAQAEAAGKAAPAERAEAAAVAAAVEAAPAVAAGRLVASPRARRLARELLIGLEHVRGTGPGGRIVEADVQATAKAGRAVRASPLARKVAQREGVDLASVRGGGTGGKVLKEDVLRAARAPAAAPAGPTAKAGQVIPLTAMRRIVAERMVHSKRTIPCYYLEMDADVTDLVALRNELNAKGDGGKISFNDFVLKACAAALRAMPAVNSRWVEGGIERRGDVHIGLAVGLDEGLIVPVIRHVDRKSLRQVSAEAADLAQRARSKKLVPDEYQGGCMTVSNLGMFGVRSFIPVVNPGESTILGLGAVQDQVVFRQGSIEVRKVMSLALSVDHRLVDGAVGAQFLKMIRDGMEAPQRLIE